MSESPIGVFTDKRGKAQSRAGRLAVFIVTPDGQVTELFGVCKKCIPLAGAAA